MRDATKKTAQSIQHLDVKQPSSRNEKERMTRSSASIPEQKSVTTGKLAPASKKDLHKSSSKDLAVGEEFLAQSTTGAPSDSVQHQ